MARSLTCKRSATSSIYHYPTCTGILWYVSTGATEFLVNRTTETCNASSWSQGGQVSIFGVPRVLKIHYSEWFATTGQRVGQKPRVWGKDSTRKLETMQLCCFIY